MTGGRLDSVCSADRRHTDDYDVACNRLYEQFHAAHPGIQPDDPAWEAFRASLIIGPRVVHLGFDAQRSALYGCPKCKAPMAWVAR